MASQLDGHGADDTPEPGALSPLSRELEDYFGIANEAELVTGESFDGPGVFLEALDAQLQLSDRARQLGVFASNLGDFPLEGAQAGQAFGGKHHDGRTDRCDSEDGERQDAFDDERQARHGRTVPRKRGKSQVRNEWEGAGVVSE